MPHLRDRYLVQASYATPSGRMSGLTFTVFAADMDEAKRLADRRVRRNGRTKIDMKITLKRLDWP